MLGAMAKAASKPSAVIDTRVIYCGDNLEQLRKLPNACVDLIYIDPPFFTGDKFTFDIEIEGEEFIKEPSMIEKKAYNDNSVHNS